MGVKGACPCWVVVLYGGRSTFFVYPVSRALKMVA